MKPQRCQQCGEPFPNDYQFKYLNSKKICKKCWKWNKESKKGKRGRKYILKRLFHI